VEDNEEEAKKALAQIPGRIYEIIHSAGELVEEFLYH